jgi:hypothetical protein
VFNTALKAAEITPQTRGKFATQVFYNPRFNRHLAGFM